MLFKKRLSHISKQIILCADDYALSPAVSEGILQLLDSDRISATSVMALCPEWQHYSAALKSFLPHKDIGLHLTLTDLKPLTLMPRFAPNGKMPSISTLIKDAYLKRLPLFEIQTEIKAQILNFKNQLGVLPDFLDGHQHVHILPGIRELICNGYAELKKEQPTLYIRNCYTPWYRVLKCVNKKKTAMISVLSCYQYRLLKKQGILTNHGFTGVYDFDQRSMPYSDIFQRFLQVATEKMLVMCHPGKIDEILKKRDPVTEQREQELKFFCSQQFLDMLSEYKIILTQMKAIHA